MFLIKLIKNSALELHASLHLKLSFILSFDSGFKSLKISNAKFLRKLIINHGVNLTLNFNNFCGEDCILTRQVFSLVGIRECYFNVFFIARFNADQCIFKSGDKRARPKNKLMTFHRAALKWCSVNCPNKIDQDRIALFSFGRFSFLFVRFLSLGQFCNFFVNLFIISFVLQSSKLQFSRINRFKVWNALNSELIF